MTGQALKVYEQMDQDQQAEIQHAYFPLWSADVAVVPEIHGEVDFRLRKWFREMYECENEKVVSRKANQVGGTIWGLLRFLFGAAYEWPRGFIYYLPKLSYTGDFVRQKVDPIMDATPGLQVARGISNVGMKQIGQGVGFFRGVEAAIARAILSVNAIMHDESDEMDPEHIRDSLTRMAASDIQVHYQLSRPSVPGYGIDKAFEESDQRYWTISCQHCRHHWTVEDTFPNCVEQDHKDLWYLACPECKEYADPRRAQWEKHNPKSNTAGFQINAIAMNPHIDLKQTMEDYNAGGSKKALVVRSKLGLAYLEESAGLNARELMGRLCMAGFNGLDKHKGPTWMGADLDDELSGHAMIVEKLKNGRPRIIKIWRFKEWKELYRAMDTYHVHTAVVDAQPQKHEARTFCEAFPVRAFMCYYSESARGGTKWDDAKHQVTVDRTESLDASHEPLYNPGQMFIPAESAEIRRWAKHCENLHRSTETTPKGNVIARWVETGADHYRHGWNYTWAAYSKPIYESVVA